METTILTNTQDIANDNDLFRTTFISIPPNRHRVVLTPGVHESPNREDIITRVREFSEFSESNDPHGEHDFGAFEIDGQRYFWKIDYYDLNLEYGAEPSELHAKVLTIMQAEEY